MNREEYLRQLQKYLKRLPKEDYANAMDYFTEYFEEAGPEGEQQVIAELGSPKEAASELLSNLLHEQTAPRAANKRSAGSILLIALLAIFAAPIGIPLVLVAICLLVVVVLIGICAIVCVLLLGVCAVLVGGKLVLCGLTSAAASIPGMCMLLGMGLVGIGAGILISIVLAYLCKGVGLLLLRLIHRVIDGKR